MSPRAALLLSALAYAGFGLWAIISVESMLGLVGVTAASAAGRVELRAFYGGLELGFAIYLGLASTREAWWPPSLAAASSIFAGCALARGGAMAWTGDADIHNLFSLSGEAAAASLTGYVYAKTRFSQVDATNE